MDVVWRENKGTLTAIGGSATTLRRERFTFDDIFAGPAAYGRLAVYTRLRTRQALMTRRSLTTLTVAAGLKSVEGSGDGTTMEPPVSVVLGDAGGAGLVSTTVDEIFASMGASAGAGEGGGGLAGLQRKTQSSAQKMSPYLHPAAAAAAGDSWPLVGGSVTLSVVLFLDEGGGVVVDLLRESSTGAGARGGGGGVCKVVRTGSGGKPYIVNASQVVLRKTADFERIAGVIFGRRSAMTASHTTRGGVNNLAEAPWLVPDMAATLLVTVAVTTAAGGRRGRGTGSSQHRSEFHFICPCGQRWASPGM